MEVCVESVESSVNAEQGGLLEVVKERTGIPVMVMLRPRGGDFIYSHDELDVMKRDLLALRHAGADGFVLGILNCDGSVNIEQCQELIGLASPLPVTFHRAIDMARDVMEALDDVIKLGCSRVLTSGQSSSALDGASVINAMIKKAAGRVSIMPGGGITPDNLQKVLEISGAKEFHGSARVTRDSEMEFRSSGVKMGSESGQEYSVKVTDALVVHQLVSIATDYWSLQQAV